MRIIVSLLLLSLLVSFGHSQNLNVSLIANLDNYPNLGYSDCWGYTASNGNDYALLGANTGVSIVNATDPNNISEVDFVDFIDFSWYDIKTYQNYMYVTTEGGSEMLIADLSTLPDSATVVGTYTAFSSEPHNIFIDIQMGLLYVIEDFNFNPSVRILDLSNPENPVEISTIYPANGGADSHDVFAQDSMLYIAEGGSGSIGIFDMSDPANPVLAQRLNIPSPGYVHNVWTTADNTYMVTTEETVGKTIKLWDIRNLNDIRLVGEYLGENEFAHNAYFKGDFAFISHYSSGFKAVDVADPSSPIEVGNFDTPNDWGVYPFSQNGLIYVSDTQSGLYILEFNNTRAYRVSGVLKDANTGQPLENGWVEITESGNVFRTDANGEFSAGFAGSGTINLNAVAFGYDLSQLQLNAVPGNMDTIEINLQPSPTGAVTGTITNQDNQPLESFPVKLFVNSALFETTQILQVMTDANGEYAFNDIPVTDSIWVDYDKVVLEQTFPFPADSALNITVSQSSPTVIDFQLSPADVFLVNDDPNADFTGIFEAAVTAHNNTFYKWISANDGSNIPVSSLHQLDNEVIIWFTGEATVDVLNQTEQDSLSLFLNNGGKLLLTGKNITESLDAQGSVFLQSYLEVNYSGNATGSPLINPVSGNPMSGGLSPFAVVQDSRDAVDPVSGGNATAAFNYANNDIAGVTVDNPATSSQIVLMGFGMEKLGSSSINNVMGAAFNWFDVTTDIQPSDRNNLPGEFTLSQNYPNPFNPTTTIEYQLPEAGIVQLKIYNVLGQVMRALVSEQQSAGSYSIQWDGKDRFGKSVASGIYIYHLTVKAGNATLFQKTKRMVLLR